MTLSGLLICQPHSLSSLQGGDAPEPRPQGSRNRLGLAELGWGFPSLRRVPMAKATARRGSSGRPRPMRAPSRRSGATRVGASRETGGARRGWGRACRGTTSRDLYKGRDLGSNSTRGDETSVMSEEGVGSWGTAAPRKRKEPGTDEVLLSACCVKIYVGARHHQSRSPAYGESPSPRPSRPFSPRPRDVTGAPPNFAPRARPHATAMAATTGGRRPPSPLPPQQVVNSTCSSEQKDRCNSPPPLSTFEYGMCAIWYQP